MSSNELIRQIEEKYHTTGAWYLRHAVHDHETTGKAESPDIQATNSNESEQKPRDLTDKLEETADVDEEEQERKLEPSTFKGEDFY